MTYLNTVWYTGYNDQTHWNNKYLLIDFYKYWKLHKVKTTYKYMWQVNDNDNDNDNIIFDYNLQIKITIYNTLENQIINKLVWRLLLRQNNLSLA